MQYLRDHSRYARARIYTLGLRTQTMRLVVRVRVRAPVGGASPELPSYAPRDQLPPPMHCGESGTALLAPHSAGVFAAPISSESASAPRTATTCVRTRVGGVRSKHTCYSVRTEAKRPILLHHGSVDSLMASN